MRATDLDSSGYIRVNERLETSTSEVWAIGKCTAAHSSHTYRRTILDHPRKILAEESAAPRDQLIHVYLQILHLPVLELTESEAQRQGITTRVARLPMNSDAAAPTTGWNSRLHEGSYR